MLHYVDFSPYGFTAKADASGVDPKVQHDTNARKYIDWVNIYIIAIVFIMRFPWDRPVHHQMVATICANGRVHYRICWRPYARMVTNGRRERWIDFIA